MFKWKEPISCHHKWNWIQGCKWWHQGLLVSCIWFLPALTVFSDWTFPHSSHFNMARSILLSYMPSHPNGNKIHIPFQKGSYWLLILYAHWPKACPGIGYCRSLIGHDLNSTLLWAKCWERMNFTQRKFRLFFPYKKVMDADKTKQTNKKQITHHMFTIAYVYVSHVFWLAPSLNENMHLHKYIWVFLFL